jgi:hypothetical protein
LLQTGNIRLPLNRLGSVMNPRIIKVIANDDYTLILEFQNGEKKIFDMRPYLDFGVFVELKNPSYFKQVHPFMGTVAWPNGQDVCPDTLYEASK